ncbi:hypothetical protein RYX36_023697 [Vicia faba]
MTPTLFNFANIIASSIIFPDHQMPFKSKTFGTIYKPYKEPKTFQLPKTIVSSENPSETLDLEAHKTTKEPTQQPPLSSELILFKHPSASKTSPSNKSPHVVNHIDTPIFSCSSEPRQETHVALADSSRIENDF